jgi:apolipoprotein N-acyltransferase
VIKKLSNIGFFVLSAVLLTVIQPPFGAGFLAWVALVPFVIGCLISEKQKPTILAAYLVSLVYWLGNLYWLEPITFIGWFLFCVYIAIYWPLIAMCLRYCQTRKVPLWLALPILIVGGEAFQGLIFRGFGWRYLGHSQYENITIIQIADIFGAAGVSFLVAMVNGLIADIVISRKAAKPRRINIIAGIFITFFIVTAAVLYGRFRINQTADFLVSGPKIGVVQSDVPTVAVGEVQPAEQTFLSALVDSRNCLMAAQPLLIIWPETIVEAVLDDSFLKLVADNDKAKMFHNALLRHSNKGVYLLVGAFAGEAVKVDNKVKVRTCYNTAFLYEPNQTGPRQHYYKIHLVPFGEYIPFKKELPFIGEVLLKLTPYNYDYTIDAGQDYTIFKIPDADKEYRFGVLICYEDTVPSIGRKLTLDKNKNKQIDWLVNISNDGWFAWQKGNTVQPTTELQQHTAICAFRAVENRMPVIRSVNTGISCYIDSLGQIHNNYIAGTVAKPAAERAGQKGWFADKVFIDKRVTVFSQAGQNLEIACGIGFIFTVFVSIYRRVVSK